MLWLSKLFSMANNFEGHFRNSDIFRYMVDEKRKFIFFHVAKTAGASIGTTLFGDKYKHVLEPLRKLESEYGIKPEQFFIFTVARNPWDRMLSDYYQSKKNNDLHIESRRRLNKVANEKDFNEWLVFFTKNFPEKHLTKNVSYLLANTKGEFSADYVIRFENLQEDVNEVFCRVGISQKTLPWLNRSQHEHYRNVYTEETKNIIEEYYKDDIQRFGYQF